MSLMVRPVLNPCDTENFVLISLVCLSWIVWEKVIVRFRSTYEAHPARMGFRFCPVMLLRISVQWSRLVLSQAY